MFNFQLLREEQYFNVTLNQNNPQQISGSFKTEVCLQPCSTTFCCHHLESKQRSVPRSPLPGPGSAFSAPFSHVAPDSITPIAYSPFKGHLPNTTTGEEFQSDSSYKTTQWGGRGLNLLSSHMWHPNVTGEKRTSNARNELALSLQPKLALQVVKYVTGVFP